MTNVRTLASSAAALSLLFCSGFASAQGSVDHDALPLFTGSASTDGPQSDGSQPDEVVLGSTLIGQPLYSLNGVDVIGEISDVAIGADGSFRFFVVAVEGREVAIEQGQIAWMTFEPDRRVLAMNAAGDRLANARLSTERAA